MQTVVFLIIYISVPIVCYRILKLSNVRFREVSVSSIFFSYYFLIAYVGILPFYFSFSRYAYFLGATDTDTIFQILVMSSSAILMTSIGYAVAEKICPLAQMTGNGETSSLKNAAFPMLIVLSIIAVIVTLLFIKNLPNVALSSVFSGDRSHLSQMRSEATSGYSGEGHFYYYRAFFQSLLPFCLYIAFSESLLTKNNWKRVIALGLFIFALFAALMNVEKAPAIWLLMGCYLTYVATRSKIIDLRSLIVVVLLLFALVCTIFYYFVGILEDRTMMDLLAWGGDRIFMGGIAPGYFYLQIFPHDHPYLMGASLPNPKGIFPWEPYRIAVEVYNYMNPFANISEVVGSAPTAFWGELYANFGKVAVFIVSPIIGVIIYIMTYLTKSIQESPIKVALTVWLAMHMMVLAETGISGYLLDVDMTVILFAALMLTIANKVRFVAPMQRYVLEE